MATEFKIRQVYLKDVSFQAPMGAAIFTEEWKPEVKVDIKVSSDPLTDTLFDVNLTLTVVSRTAGQTAFMIEVVYSGVFTIIGYTEAQRHRILNTVCPNALYPYARETIDNLTLKGRFPAMILEPVDFDATYTA
jgi:preprotein translocase subunit SecB